MEDKAKVSGDFLPGYSTPTYPAHGTGGSAVAPPGSMTNSGRVPPFPAPKGHANTRCMSVKHSALPIWPDRQGSRKAPVMPQSLSHPRSLAWCFGLTRPSIYRGGWVRVEGNSLAGKGRPRDLLRRSWQPLEVERFPPKANARDPGGFCWSTAIPGRWRPPRRATGWLRAGGCRAARIRCEVHGVGCTSKRHSDLYGLHRVHGGRRLLRDRAQTAETGSVLFFCGWSKEWGRSGSVRPVIPGGSNTFSRVCVTFARDGEDAPDQRVPHARGYAQKEGLARWGLGQRPGERPSNVHGWHRYHVKATSRKW
jgi:hypothetical protein